MIATAKLRWAADFNEKRQNRKGMRKTTLFLAPRREGAMQIRHWTAGTTGQVLPSFFECVRDDMANWQGRGG
jgi:hypothetical protein